jgi:prolyl oligopeptidase
MWDERVSEQAEALQSVLHVKGHLIGHYLKDARSVLRVFREDGSYLSDIKLPTMGTARKLGGKSGFNEAFFSFSSFTVPAAVYRYDVAQNKLAVFRKPKLEVRPENFETRQVFYESKDGTKVPMFITHKKGLKLDGKNPTYLYGYGGFNIPITPYFSPALLTWLEMGGVYAVPNLRGGSEYGEDWHRGGMLRKKQNVFDDFIAAAQWLIDNRYTRSEKLAIAGYSNGGLLVGAVMTQRPELFGAALPGVGVLDMLRFHKFTIGIT